ncbi:DUF4357 domain-containing protein [Paracoccus sp. PARArs4]|uniref:DUF4357 domain-containing protein n=1 Tax=Paracoccus sp. PARArs4 TaxID=2853442 RepID=UPI0024A77E27|nr:DUF4357 domain-containing protein [Paracoccus sp. PARArs4]
MEGFIEELELILPVIGIHLLRRPRVRAPQPAIVAEPAPRFVLVHEGRGIDAVATEEEGEFVLLAGSRGSLHRGPSFHDHIALLRDQAVESGRAVAEEDGLRLVEDIAFSSPSAAAVFLFGTSRNGRTDWLVEGGAETYGAFNTRRLAQVPTA